MFLQTFSNDFYSFGANTRIKCKDVTCSCATGKSDQFETKREAQAYTVCRGTELSTKLPDVCRAILTLISWQSIIKSHSHGKKKVKSLVLSEQEQQTYLFSSIISVLDNDQQRRESISEIFSNIQP